MTGMLFKLGNGFFLMSVLISCASLKAKHGLIDGPYKFKQAGDEIRRVTVYAVDDSIKVFEKSNRIAIQIEKPSYFYQQTFDFDALTIPFKFRPAASLLPRQLDTDFNGNIYLGYRFDRFKMTFHDSPVGYQKEVKHLGLSAGVFGGLGSAFISPWTTRGGTDEYNGFIFSKGVACLIGAKNLTFGFGVGWDFLTDRDRAIWIYQNKPWYGLTIGLNVN
jgi:hypothetical protein